MPRGKAAKDIMESLAVLMADHEEEAGQCQHRDQAGGGHAQQIGDKGVPTGCVRLVWQRRPGILRCSSTPWGACDLDIPRAELDKTVKRLISELKKFKETTAADVNNLVGPKKTATGSNSLGKAKA